jgi:ubiquinone biosynthesis monooxygenase Coq7
MQSVVREGASALYNEVMESDRLLDPLIGAFDRALRALFAPASGERSVPGSPPAAPLSEPDRRQAAALMRVNHSGEVAAQALYHGQAFAARSGATHELLEKAGREETDHLAWCEARLKELGTRASLLNPVWYLGSFAIGVLAGSLGDRASLGFVAETERQVEGHLDSHLARLPSADTRSRAIISAMQADEIAHGARAIAAGAGALPTAVVTLMRCAARVMTGTAYWV